MATEWERHIRAGQALSGLRGSEVLPPRSTQGWQMSSPRMQVDGTHFGLENGMVSMELVTKRELVKVAWETDLPRMLMPGHGGEYAAFAMGFLLGELPAKFNCGNSDVSRLINEYTQGSMIELAFRDGEERQYELKEKRDQLFFAMDFATPGQEDVVSQMTMRGRSPQGNPSAYTLDVRYPEGASGVTKTTLSVANKLFGYLHWNQNLLEWMIKYHNYSGHIENPALSAHGLAPLIQEEVRSIARK